MALAFVVGAGCGEDGGRGAVGAGDLAGEEDAHGDGADGVDDLEPLDDAPSDTPIEDVTPDVAEDVAEDAPPAFAHCEATPGTVDRATEERPGSVRIACGGHDLRVAAHDGMARLIWLPPGTEPAPRRWGIPTPPDPVPASVGAVGDDVEVCWASAAVRVTPDGRVRVRDASGAVVLEDGPDGGFATTNGGARVTHASPASERFYGLGEKTGPMDKRGRRMTFWNTDAYDPAFGGYAPESDPLYLSIPFLISLRDGRASGVFTDNTWRMTLDLAATAPDRWSAEVEGGLIDQWVILGPDVPGVVERYTALTGRMAMPPRWALGYHQCRWGYGPEARVREVAARFRALSIPADVLWLDIQHMDGFRTFTFDPLAFPDPERLMADLAADGFAVVAIADPGIKVDAAWDVYQSGVASNIFLKTSGDALYVGRVWTGDAVFQDFLNPAAHPLRRERVFGWRDQCPP